MRRLMAVILCITVLIIIPITSNAHSGKTDSKGGHTNSSTGEYHYHHGYPEHDHYDMNADGFVDCPYDFYDNTSKKSTSGSVSSSVQTITFVEEVEVIKEVPYTPTWAKWLMWILSVSTIWLFVSNRSKCSLIKDQNNLIDQLKRSHEDELTAKTTELKNQINGIKSSHLKEIEEICSRYNSTISSITSENEQLKSELNSVITSIPVGSAFYPQKGKLMYKIELPSDVYLDNNHIPIKGYATSSRPFGDFTVFTLDRSNIYHCNLNCSNSFRMKPVHLFDVIKIKTPCARCGKYLGNSHPKWYEDLIKLKELTK